MTKATARATQVPCNPRAVQPEGRGAQAKNAAENVFGDKPVPFWCGERPRIGSGRPAAARAGGHGVRRPGARNLDFDLEDCDLVTVLDPDLDLVGRDIDVLGDDAQDVLAQDRDQPRMTRGAAFVRQQDLESLAREWRGSTTSQEAEEFHAALLPKSFVSRVLRSVGIVIATDSPFSRRAASM